MNSSVGIITYHAAYNFGSVLQAYATQEAYAKCGAISWIINYRPKSQVAYYEPLYRTSYSAKTFVRDLFLAPVKKKRLLRADRFERFINSQLHLTERVDSADQLRQFSDAFDLYVSGSDQILNIHSNEYQGEGWDAMKPYLLDFALGRKVSYASSPANSTVQDLLHISDDLKSFSLLSAREQDAAKRLSQITGMDVFNVLDPTLLLTRDKWREVASNAAPTKLSMDHYVMYYTLDGTKAMLNRIELLNRLSDVLEKPVVVISPFAIFPQSNKLIDGRAAGPAEFISLIDNASLVVTDSYHGTLFSMNLETPFFSISNGKGSSTRKDQVLDRMHARDSVVNDLQESIRRLEVSGPPAAKHIDDILIPIRESSFAYIRKTLQLR